MKKVLMDTYAWIEYLEGSEKGEKVKEVLEDETDTYTALVSVAELADAFHRGDVETKFDWQEILDYIQLNSVIVELNEEGMASAGTLKVKRREEFDDFGLMDAIILESSRKVGAKLMTGDPHLTGEDNSIAL